MQVSLCEVHQAAKRLQDQCHDSGRFTDLAFLIRHINSAYDVAKAARQLIISVEQEKKGEHYHSSLEGGLGKRLYFHDVFNCIYSGYFMAVKLIVIVIFVRHTVIRN